jgi:hypothetical protein
MANFFYHKRLEELPDDFFKIIEMESSGVERCVRDPGLVGRHGIHRDASIVDAFAHLAPVIDTDAYMVCHQFVTST